MNMLTGVHVYILLANSRAIIAHIDYNVVWFQGLGGGGGLGCVVSRARGGGGGLGCVVSRARGGGVRLCGFKG